MSLIILDGATGTEMQKLGFRPGGCLESFVLEHSEELIGLQKRYIEAGSDVIYAPTFGANRVFLKKHGLEGKTAELNARLVGLSQEASRGRALVGGDLAPTGVPMEPYGDMERDELLEIYAQQARALERAGVDMFALETQMCGAEAETAFEAVRLESGKPIYVSFTCNAQGLTLYGEKLTELGALFGRLGAAAFGINCCGDFGLLEELVPQLAAASGIPVIVKPNAGQPEMRGGIPEYRMTPEFFAEHMVKLHGLGASVLGGCCGTNEEFISKMAKILKS